MKKMLILFIFLLLILSIAVFAFFYYVRPQREFIKATTQACIGEAMSPINKEIEYDFGGAKVYKNDAELTKMLQNQHTALLECVLNYNTVLFSSPEKKLVESKLDSSLKNQKASIDSYRKRAIDYKVEQNQIKKQTGSVYDLWGAPPIN